MILSFNSRSLNPNLRIIPSHTVLIVQIVKIIAFIAKLFNFAQYQKSMCESSRNQKLLLVFFCQFDTILFSVCFASASQIHNYIKNRTFNYSHQFCLWIILLEMKPLQYTFGTHRLVILNKRNINLSFLHNSLAISPHEIGTTV